ncbi:NADPH-dependent FMN reductase [Halomonas sp. GXIMD04776]|uniref:NADPH-dependent FMN reductase n=1 Tax=Halomonas sp. GXIMD04776 TaxID=3415605 RepID=UPI003CB4294F
MKILGISGSLRKASYNTHLLEAAREAIGSAATFATFDIGGIPHYHGDQDGEEKPPSVQKLKDDIASADGVVIATPEYNYSLPGVLKNAIDWASRPAFKSVLKDKPIIVLSASMSATGGARAQVHLRDILAGVLAPVFAAPDFLVPTAQNKFDDDGKLTDTPTQEMLQKRMDSYLEWVRRLSS